MEHHARDIITACKELKHTFFRIDAPSQRRYVNVTCNISIKAMFSWKRGSVTFLRGFPAI